MVKDDVFQSNQMSLNATCNLLKENLGMKIKIVQEELTLNLVDRCDVK
jgi:hypothetical protein